MELANPFAPPSAPLDDPTPRAVRSRWAALWWLPTGVFGGTAVFLFLCAAAIGSMAAHGFWASGGDLGAGRPPVGRSIVVTLITGGACLGCALIAHAWHRRRWRLALLLMALAYGVGVATALILDGR